MTINVKRLVNYFSPDPKRVIVRFFMPGGEERAKKIITRIHNLEEEDVIQVLNQTLRDFSNRHRNITKVFLNHFEKVSFLFEQIDIDSLQLSKERKLLIGAYFTHEYSIESAAFFNPSMVEDPDQSHLENGHKRVIVSFRATGEGHVSSIGFRSAIVDRDNKLLFSPVSKLVDMAETIQLHEYNKKDFIHKLLDMNFSDTKTIYAILSPLNDSFLFRDLLSNINAFVKNNNLTMIDNTILKAIRFTANAQYKISFSLDTSLSERVIFPVTDSESNGIEDARFVKFIEDDNTTKYYATYTAYNGYVIMPQLIETNDFYTFTVMPIYGKNAQNKGMTLFPRKINGKYAMLSRHDGENNYLMYSDSINNWDGEAILLQEPKFPWEFVQLGNSGSPLETDKGWLVITHSVGAMRRYVLGAILLDLEDPSKMIAQLNTPLLVANEEEREGYVPNVVYSCGSMIHNNSLIIPYAMSDTSSGFACIELHELFSAMLTDQSAQKAQKKQILLVEDDIFSATIVEKILMDAGYDVEVANDGLIALVKVGEKTFDLILTDVNMPKFSGFELLEFLQKNNLKTPVVLLTGRTDNNDKIKGLQLGATEYLNKTIGAELLLSKLANILSD
ncbi:response regulator [Flavobacterium sp. TSSA_36]|uniref:glycoside hydrolase family 130 protein n=1 Tax=Flavobacterium sp. TSSA_36 TaxID=3447669 RepID=UPI003F3C8B3C